MSVSVAEFFKGVGIVVLIAIFAGAIAYVGDRVGHQVGRKRLTLFNIRPRYTSTIVAIATGMIIAIVLTIGAILASQQVKLAFFKLGAINAQIEQLQARARALESKVNSKVIVNVGDPMVPVMLPLSSAESSRERLSRVRQYYNSVVASVDQRYKGLLKPYVPPSDVERRLKEVAGGDKVQDLLAKSPVLVMALADQNLYLHRDAISFSLTVIPDVLAFRARQYIAPLGITAGHNVNIGLALSELSANVSNAAAATNLPPFIASQVRVTQTYPALAQMQQMVTHGNGRYVLAAFAATDIYPHTGEVPVVVVLEPGPQ